MFITLEGPEGSGKSSQLPGLAEFLRNSGYRVVETREPGGTAVGDQIREVLMNLENVTIVPRTEILLLEAGNIVLCDRFGDSTLAYQGYGHQTDLNTLRSLLDFSTGGLKPDLTLLLDVPVVEGFKRKRGNQVEWNRLDAYTEAFHKRVRQGYLALAKQEPERWLIIDASQDKEKVQEAMRTAVINQLEGHPSSYSK